MKKTLINQALKNAVGQESCGNTSVQAEKTDPAALSATGAASPPGTGRRAYDPRRNNGDARGGAIPYLPTYLQVILLRAKLTFSAERSAAPPKTVPKGKCRILAPYRTFRTSILRIRTLYHAIFADFCRKDRMYSQLILLPNG